MGMIGKLAPFMLWWRKRFLQTLRDIMLGEVLFCYVTIFFSNSNYQYLQGFLKSFFF